MRSHIGWGTRFRATSPEDAPDPQRPRESTARPSRIILGRMKHPRTAKAPCPWTESRQFVPWARSLKTVRGLPTDVVGLVAGALRGENQPIPQDVDPSGLTLDAATAWTALALSRDPQATMWVSHRSVVPEIWWECSDVPALLDRFERDAPHDLPGAVVSAVNADALSAADGLNRILGCTPTALRECLDALLLPWSRAAEFPQSLFEALRAVPTSQHLALQLAHHWCRPELFAIALDQATPTQQRLWALRHSAVHHLQPAPLESLCLDPRLRVAAVEALSRAVQGAHRHKPNLSLLLSIFEQVGPEIAAFLPPILLHHQASWCSKLQDLSPTDPAWPAHLLVLAALEHPSADALLELWWERSPRADLALELCRRGSQVAVDYALQEHHTEAIGWLDHKAWPKVMARFETHEDPVLAAWLAAHTDHTPDPRVVELLTAQQISVLHRGLPHAAEATLFASGENPFDPQATSALQQLGECADRAWGAPLARLAIETPSSAEELAEAAWQALLAMDRRLTQRGSKRSFAGETLLEWLHGTELNHRSLPRALELLLELPAPVCPPNLQRMLRKGSPDVQKHAIRLLRHGPAGQLRQAVAFLEGQDFKLQRAAVDAIAGRPGFEHLVVPLLRARNMNVRRTAAKALANSRDPEIVDALIDAVCSHDNRGFQSECLRAAKGIVGPAVWHRLQAHDSMQAAQALADRPTKTREFSAGREPEQRADRVEARRLALGSDADERLRRICELQFPYTQAERQLATDPKTDAVWRHGLRDRLLEGEVSAQHCLLLLKGTHQRSAVDVLLRAQQEAEVLEHADLAVVRERWREPEHTLALLQNAGAKTLKWRWEIGQLEPVQLVALLRGGPAEQAFAKAALRTTPCALEALTPLLEEPPNTARAAAAVLADWGTPQGHELLVDAFLNGKLDDLPRGAMPSNLIDRDAPIERKLTLVNRSTDPPEHRRQALERLASLDKHGHHARDFESAYRTLPVELFIEEAVAGRSIPAGVVGRGPLPVALIDQLEDAESPACVDLLLRWQAVGDPEGRVASLLEQRAQESWTPVVLQRLCLWSSDPLRAASCAHAVGVYHSPLHLDFIEQVPHSARLEVLQQLREVADTEPRLLELLHLRPGQSAKTHPIDELPSPLRERLWSRTHHDCSSPDPAVVRRSLWALHKHEEFEAVLVAAHAHPSRNVKLYANRLLRRSSARDVWLEQCTQLLTDRDVAVLRPMTRIVASQKHEPAVRALVAMMDRSRTRDLAEQALRLFGADAIPELERMMGRLRPDRRAKLQELIASLHVS